jgi:hypothetical protein
LSWSSVEHAEYYPVHIYANGHWHHIENSTGTGVNYDYQQRSWDPYTLRVKILACKAKPWWLFWAWWEHDRCSGWSNTVGISPASATQLTYQYDKLSRLTKVVIPHRQLQINYVYDAMGNRLVRHTDTINQQRSPGSHSLSMLQPTDLRAAPFDDLTLEWDHHAPQGWRGHYSVYFGDSNPPNLYKSGLTEKTLHIGRPLGYAHYFLQIKAIDQWGDAHSSTVWAISPSDADSDGIPDHIENKLCTDVQNPDTDSDGLLDGDEDKPIFGVISDRETNPCNPDTDGDLIPDGWERYNGLDPLDPSDATSDTDGDGFTALEEYVSGDDPNSFDSAPVGIEFDFEGKNLPESLSWIREGNQSWELDQSDPLQGEQSLKSSGTLGSNQSSVIKTHVMSTGGIVRFDLKLWRSSGGLLQFYLDGELLQEWRGSSSGMPQTMVVFDLPAGAHELKWRYYSSYSLEDGAAWIDRLFISAQADSDGDDVIDSWEQRYFRSLDQDLSLDTDGDGLTHLQEYQAKTAPDTADTDGDLILDGWERDNGLDPLDPSDATSDTDGDGFTALEEYVSGDDPNRFDSAPVGIEFNFEEEDLSELLFWIHEGNQSWELDQSDPLHGEQSLKSGVLGNSQSSVIKTHVMSTGGIVRFDLKLGRSSGDRLQFYLDGELLQEWRGSSSGMPQTMVVFDLPAGAHELKWYYYSRYYWEDGAAWIDRLFISAQADSDGDDVIDSWELGNFSHLDEDLSLDADEDGLTHLQEYQAKTAPDTADTDGDGLTDSVEIETHGTNPLLSDTDGDGFSDGKEVAQGTDPNDTHSLPDTADTDGDRMPDDWELNNRLDSQDASDATSDNDQDGFMALEEYTFSTDPNQSDSVPGIRITFEGDRLPESLPWIHKGDQPWELDQFDLNQGQQLLKSGPITHNQSSSLKTQVQVTSDGGLVYFALKVSSDSCCDKLGFFLDGELLQEWSGEIPLLFASFYLPPGSHELMWRYSKDDSVNRGKDAAWIYTLVIYNDMQDSDKDGVLDPWELGSFGSLDTDLSLDSDNDGLTHLQEYQYRTSPDLPDSDVDSILDGLEVQYATDPNNPDSDGDLITDGWEVNHDLDPLDGSDASGDIDNDGQSNFVEYVLSIPTKSTNMDSDEDGMSDLWEAQNKLNPLEPSDAASDNDGDGFSALQEYESGTDPNQYGSAPTSIGLNRSIGIKDNKTTIIDQPLISAAPIISKDSAVSYKVADKSDRHTTDNLLYAGVSGVQQQNYLQYSPYLDIDTAGVMSFSQLERYHQNLNHLHRQLINYQPTN